MRALGSRLGVVSRDLMHQTAGFIKRDAKPETRNAMEAGAKNLYWQDVARRFNDPTFKQLLDGGRTGSFYFSIFARMDAESETDGKRVAQALRGVLQMFNN